MATSTGTTDIEARLRELPAPLYGFLYAPTGLTTGFVSVTLGYLLTHHGVSVAAVGAIVGLNVLPQTWKFVAGPVVDTSLTPRIWCALTLLLGVALLAAFAVVPLTPAGVPTLGALALAAGAAMSASGSSVTAAMAQTTPSERRGAVAAWQQVGALGGTGLGGGLGLWIAEHAGGQASAALTLAALCLVCAWPLLLLRTEAREAGLPLWPRLVDVWDAFWTLARTRSGALIILVVTLPACLGAAGSLLSAVAGDWHASADLVALMLGAVSGVANLPGCLIGGYLCDRFPRRPVYVTAALACALGEAAMALGPHTPFAFCAFVILNAVLLGVGWASVSAVVFDKLSGRGAATVASVLSSLANLPVSVMTVVVARAQVKHGSTGMLLIEAGIAVVAMALYCAVASLWRPTPTQKAALAAA